MRRPLVVTGSEPVLKGTRRQRVRAWERARRRARRAAIGAATTPAVNAVSRPRRARRRQRSWAGRSDGEAGARASRGGRDRRSRTPATQRGGRSDLLGGEGGAQSAVAVGSPAEGVDEPPLGHRPVGGQVEDRVAPLGEVGPPHVGQAAGASGRSPATARAGGCGPSASTWSAGRSSRPPPAAGRRRRATVGIGGAVERPRRVDVARRPATVAPPDDPRSRIQRATRACSAG